MQMAQLILLSSHQCVLHQMKKDHAAQQWDEFTIFIEENSESKHPEEECLENALIAYFDCPMRIVSVYHRPDGRFRRFAT